MDILPQKQQWVLHVASSPANSGVHSFGTYEFEPRTGELRKHGIRIRLEGQPLAILTILLDRPGELVTREELQKRLWPGDTFVDFEHGLNAAIKRLRGALNDSANAPRYIETLASRGYRFVAPLNAASSLSDAAAVEGTKPQADSAKPSKAHRWPLWLSIAAATLAAVLGWNWRSSIGRILHLSPSPAIHSLAVLPLENLSGDASQEYFADGMTDALITDLAQIGALRVISRTSVMRYKGLRKPLSEIARELDVDGIVEGTVVRSGNRIRITSQLIYAPSDQHLWAHSYERDLKDVLTLQGEVAQAIADEVRAAVTPEQRARLNSRATVNPKVYEASLKGRYFWNKRSTEALPKALEYFQQAVDTDPSYAPAYVGLADTYGQYANWGLLPPREVMPKARAAALRALEIDEVLAEAHVSLGMVKLTYDWDWPAAGKQFERALALNPESPAAHESYSSFLVILGKSQESLTEAKRAIDLDPVSPDVNHHLAWLLSLMGRYDEAVEQERKTLEIDPDFPPAHAVLEGAYEAKGLHQEALMEMRKLSGLSSDSPSALADSAYIHARSAQRSQALRELGELQALSKQRYVPSNMFALVYLGLDDKDQVFQWLEKASEERAVALPFLQVSARWAPLRSDPRFSNLLRRLGPQE